MVKDKVILGNVESNLSHSPSNRERAVRIQREQLVKRVRHFSDGVIVGGRQLIDEWFEGNRSWFGGKSQTDRKTGARPIHKGMKGLYNLRELKGSD